MKVEENDNCIRWEAHDPGASQKSGNWYWTVGIIAGGVAIASVIGGNLLLAAIAVIGGFAVMLAGSHPGGRRVCAVTGRGIHVGREVIPYANIKRFSIKESDPKKLVIETVGLIGTISLALGDADWRAIRTELKNRNIDEDDALDSFAEKIAEMMGI